MTEARRFQLDDLTIRPGTYFNPQTEVMIVVDDSPEVDHELFNTDDFGAADWVLISEDSPVDEHKRDQLVELFQVTYQPGGDPVLDADLDDDVEDDEDDLDVDELGVDGLEVDSE